MTTIKHYINEDIIAKQVRIVEDSGIGEVVTIEEALGKSDELDLDLIQVGGNDEIAICRLGDYRKHLYNITKKARTTKTTKNKQQTKRIVIGNKIHLNDLIIKTRQIDRILNDGYGVRVEVVYKGRMINQIKHGLDMLGEVVNRITAPHKVIVTPTIEKNTVYMVIHNINK